MVVGVNEAYKKTLEINGVGYRASKEGKNLVMWAARAALSVMTPLDVEMMAIPRPRRTLGSSSAPA